MYKDKSLLAIITAILFILLSALCGARNKIAPEPTTCILPAASVALTHDSETHVLTIELQNNSQSTLEFDNWSMMDPFIDLSAISASGKSLRRFVISQTPGFQALKLNPGERRKWTYNIETAFPDLKKVVEAENVNLAWSTKVSPLGLNCSMSISGTAGLSNLKAADTK